jgi:hypothetical protein
MLEDVFGGILKMIYFFEAGFYVTEDTLHLKYKDQ